jgi:hypothetical protein
MKFLSTLNDLFVKTHLYPLVLQLLPAANNDHDAAWAAAKDAILLYDPQTEAEFRLACRLAVFSILTTHGAAQSAVPGQSAAIAAHFRGSATAFAREADKAESELDNLRQARIEVSEPQPAPQPATQSAPQTPRPAITTTPLPADKKQEIKQIAAYARKYNLTYPQAWTQFELARKQQASTAAPTG